MKTTRLTAILLCALAAGMPFHVAAEAAEGSTLIEPPTTEIVPRVYTWWNGEPYWLANAEPPVGDDVDRRAVPRELLEPAIVTDRTPAFPPPLAVMASASTYSVQMNGIRAEPASDTQYVNGLWSTISIAQAANLGNGGFSSWPGMYLANGDFIQVGYETAAAPITGLPQLKVFVQIWKNGYGSHTCTNPGAYVYCYSWTGLIGAGQTHAFYLKNGVNGDAYRWGFFLNSDSNLLTSIVLGASNSGTNTGYALNERIGSPPTATITSNTWDCGLCQLKNGVWSTPSHAEYYKAGNPPCPPMGFTPLYSNEFRMGSLEGCSYWSGRRVW